MKPWTTWLARLGIAGACFLVTGCGGGDVPDASSDGQAATESACLAPAVAEAPAPAAGRRAEGRPGGRCRRRTADEAGCRAGGAEPGSGTRDARSELPKQPKRPREFEHRRNAGHGDRPIRRRLECARRRFSRLPPADRRLPPGARRPVGRAAR